MDPDTTELFEEYCRVDLEDLRDQKVRELCTKVGGIEKLLALNMREPYSGTAERYDDLRGVARDLHGLFPDESAPGILLFQMFDIDSKRSDTSGLCPKQRTAALAADQAEFRDKMRSGRAALRALPKVYREYYEEFCHVVFVLGEYRGPHRVSSAGVVELWSEFLQTVRVSETQST